MPTMQYTYHSQLDQSPLRQGTMYNIFYRKAGTQNAWQLWATVLYKALAEDICSRLRYETKIDPKPYTY
jgi:hypothetical protein